MPPEMPFEQQNLPELPGLEDNDDGVEDAEEEGDSTKESPEEKSLSDESREGRPSHEEDDEEYGQRVKKRINKEVSRRKVEEQRRIIAESQLRALEARLAQLETGHHSLAEKLQEEATTHYQKTLEEQIEAANGKLKEAVEQVDPAATAEAVKQLFDLNNKKLALESARKAEPAPRKVAQPAPPATPELTPAAQRWLARNSWYTKPEYADWQVKVRALEGQLIEEGYSVDSDKLYALLDKRLRTKASGGNGQSAGGSYDKGGGVSRRQRANVTEEEAAKMADIGLDPKNPKHVQTYLKELAAL